MFAVFRQEGDGRRDKSREKLVRFFHNKEHSTHTGGKLAHIHTHTVGLLCSSIEHQWLWWIIKHSRNVPGSKLFCRNEKTFMLLAFSEWMRVCVFVSVFVCLCAYQLHQHLWSTALPWFELARESHFRLMRKRGLNRIVGLGLIRWRSYKDRVLIVPCNGRYEMGVLLIITQGKATSFVILLRLQISVLSSDGKYSAVESSLFKRTFDETHTAPHTHS